MRGLVALLLLASACACPSKQAGANTGTTGGGSGSGGGEQVPLTGCDAASARIGALYRADAQANEPKRVDEAVADNTAMVMAECAKAPDRMLACLSGVTTVADLERQCLPTLDEEGSEADVLVR